MNVLYVSVSFPDKENSDIGGMFLLHEAVAYSNVGMNVTVLTPHKAGAIRQERINERLLIRRFRYFLPERMQSLRKTNQPIYRRLKLWDILQVPIFTFVFILQILKYAKSCDIIHCQWTVTFLLAMPAKYFFKTKIVVTARGSDIRLFPDWLNRWILREADGVIDCFGDQKWNNDLKKKFLANYIKLPLIVSSLQSKKTISSGTTQNISCLKILYLGRIDQVKIDDGLPIFELIESARLLKESNHDPFHILYVGDGSQEIIHEMKNRIKRFDLDSEISLLGPKANVYDYIQWCDIGVGGIAFNAVSQEFSFLKKPQILFANEYNEQTPWVDQENCYIVEQHDPDQLLDVLLFALSHKLDLREIGEQAGELISNYIVDDKKGAQAYLDAFKVILKD